MLRPHLLIAMLAAGLGILVACGDADISGAATPDSVGEAPPPSGTPSSGGIVSPRPYSATLDDAGLDEGDAGPGVDASMDAGKDASTSSSGTSGTSTSSSASSSGTSGTSTTSSASSSGTSGTSTSSASSSSSGGTAGTCSVTRSGGTGNDPSGIIPVCCSPTAPQKTELDALFKLLNDYRAEKGKAAVTYDTKLEAAVQGHCEHMIDHGFFDHIAPEAAVAQPTERAKLCGTTALAENLAGGQSTPAAVMASWKSSPGHDSVMLGNYKRVGLCRAGSYWGQLFGN